MTQLHRHIIKQSQISMRVPMNVLHYRVNTFPNFYICFVIHVFDQKPINQSQIISDINVTSAIYIRGNNIDK